MQAKGRRASTYAKKPHPETHRVGWVAWLCSMPSLCCSIAQRLKNCKLVYHERGENRETGELYTVSIRECLLLAQAMHRMKDRQHDESIPGFLVLRLSSCSTCMPRAPAPCFNHVWGNALVHCLILAQSQLHQHIAAVVIHGHPAICWYRTGGLLHGRVGCQTDMLQRPWAWLDSSATGNTVLPLPCHVSSTFLLSVTGCCKKNIACLGSQQEAQWASLSNIHFCRSPCACCQLLSAAARAARCRNMLW